MPPRIEQLGNYTDLTFHMKVPHDLFKFTTADLLFRSHQISGHLIINEGIRGGVRKNPEGTRIQQANDRNSPTVNPPVLN